MFDSELHTLTFLAAVSCFYSETAYVIEVPLNAAFWTVICRTHSP
jgi:hypothetical protein